MRWILAALLALAGCSSSFSVLRDEPPPHPLSPQPPNTVPLLYAVPHDRPFTRVAIFHVDQSRYVDSDTDVLTLMRRHGERIGCDAVVITVHHGDGWIALCVVYD